MSAYDDVAPRYDALLAGDVAMREQLHAAYDVFEAGDRVVDAGCGTGIDTAWLEAQGIDVVAVDTSEGMLAELAAKRLQADVRRVDLRRLDWLGGPYDGVVSGFAAINSVPDAVDVCRRAGRILRPGGHLVVHGLNRRPGQRRREWARIGDQRVLQWRHRVRMLAGIPGFARVSASAPDLPGPLGEAPGLRWLGRWFLLVLRRI